MNKQRIVVGLTGGVDSAVTAHLLKQQGHEVVGIFMKNWEDDDDSEYCSSNVDFVDAAAVADVLGIEIEHVNFAADYKDRVFAEFLREYQAGRTPNPDVLCNAEIKFKAFLDHAMRLGAEKIATGHYARVRSTRRRGRYELLKGLDPAKDQSYFLHRLNQAQLSQDAVPGRRAAQDRGAPHRRRDRPAEREEEGLDRHLLHRRAAVPRVPEPLHRRTSRARSRTSAAARIGEHQGLSFYTLGQRQGLGIGGVKEKGAQRGGGEHAPWFVARKDMASNTLWVVQGHDHPWLQSRALDADDASWVAGARAARRRATPPRRATARPMRPARSADGADGAFRLRLRRAAVGGDAGPVGGAVRRRGVPGRRRDFFGRLTGRGRTSLRRGGRARAGGAYCFATCPPPQAAPAAPPLPSRISTPHRPGPGHGRWLLGGSTKPRLNPRAVGWLL